MNVRIKIIKATCMGAIVALAMSASAALSASAATGGHFVSGNSHTILSGTDSTTDPVEFTVLAVFKCSDVAYDGTMGETETQLTITPTYDNCTYGQESATIDMNGCDYVFTIDTSPEDGYNTFHLVCPDKAGPLITVTPGFGPCTVTITPNQTPSGGISYTTDTVESIHKIKGDVAIANLHTVYHGGFFACGVSGGHTTASTIHGTLTLEGRDTFGNRVPVTAT